MKATTMYVHEYTIYQYDQDWQIYKMLSTKEMTLETLISFFKDIQPNFEQLKNDILDPKVQFCTNRTAVDKEDNNRIVLVPLEPYEGEDTGYEFITTIDELISLTDQWEALMKKRPPYILVYRDLDNKVHFTAYNDIKDMPTLNVLPSTHTCGENH